MINKKYHAGEFTDTQQLALDKLYSEYLELSQRAERKRWKDVDLNRRQEEAWVRYDYLYKKITLIKTRDIASD